jgi:hypothetical protein
MLWIFLRYWPRIHVKKLKITMKYLINVADNAVDIRAKIKFHNFNAVFMNVDADGIFTTNP